MTFSGTVTHIKRQQVIENWSLKNQADGIDAFLKAIDGLTDEERNMLPDAKEFHEQYHIKFRQHEPLQFDFEDREE